MINCYSHGNSSMCKVEFFIRCIKVKILQRFMILIRLLFEFPLLYSFISFFSGHICWRIFNRVTRVDSTIIKYTIAVLTMRNVTIGNYHGSIFHFVLDAVTLTIRTRHSFPNTQISFSSTSNMFELHNLSGFLVYPSLDIFFLTQKLSTIKSAFFIIH